MTRLFAALVAALLSMGSMAQTVAPAPTPAAPVVLAPPAPAKEAQKKTSIQKSKKAALKAKKPNKKAKKKPKKTKKARK